MKTDDSFAGMDIGTLPTKNIYFNVSGECIKCPVCACKKINYVTKDTINGIISEASLVCDKCKTEVGYYEYGHFDPCYLMMFENNNLTITGVQNDNK